MRNEIDPGNKYKKRKQKGKFLGRGIYHPPRIVLVTKKKRHYQEPLLLLLP